MSTDSTPSIALLLEATSVLPANVLALSLSLPQINQQQKEDFDFVLQHSAQGWQLQQTGKRAPGPVRVDFSSSASSYRRNKGGGS